MQVTKGIRRQAVLVRSARNETIHLIAGSNHRGLVFFCCAHEPLLTLKSHGLPARCPICQQSNPITSGPDETTTISHSE